MFIVVTVNDGCQIVQNRVPLDSTVGELKKKYDEVE